MTHDEHTDSGDDQTPEASTRQRRVFFGREVGTPYWWLRPSLVAGFAVAIGFLVFAPATVRLNSLGTTDETVSCGSIIIQPNAVSLQRDVDPGQRAAVRRYLMGSSKYDPSLADTRRAESILAQRCQDARLSRQTVLILVIGAGLGLLVVMRSLRPQPGEEV